MYRAREIENEVIHKMAGMQADGDTRIVGLTALARATGMGHRDVGRALQRLLVRGDVGKVLRGRRSGYFLNSIS